MGKCKYCGNSAGFLFSYHKKCEHFVESVSKTIFFGTGFEDLKRIISFFSIPEETQKKCLYVAGMG
jgi:hypothetical protein